MGAMMLTSMTILYYPTPVEWDLQGLDSLPRFCKPQNIILNFYSTRALQKKIQLALPRYENINISK
jgi:hypothetical protein